MNKNINQEINDADELQLPDLISSRHNHLSTWKRPFVLLGGCVCVVIGVVGWVLPFIPGVPLVIFGMAVSACAVPWIAEKINWLEKTLPYSVRLWFRPELRKSLKNKQRVGMFFENDRS